MNNNKIYTNTKEIIGLAHKNQLSLAVFKATSILDFTAEVSAPEWPAEKISKALDQLKQGDLFQDQNPEDFKIMPKLPYKFSYKFRDDAGTESKLMIEDWEIGQLYLNCVKHYGEEQAVGKVREKYLDNFAKTKDLHLFLGTTFEWHIRKAKNPFVIIGTFYPPHTKQTSLL